MAHWEPVVPSGEEAWEVGGLATGFLGCAAAFGAGAWGGGGGAGFDAIDVGEDLGVGDSGVFVIGCVIGCATVGRMVLVVSGSAGWITTQYQR